MFSQMVMAAFFRVPRRLGAAYISTSVLPLICQCMYISLSISPYYPELILKETRVLSFRVFQQVTIPTHHLTCVIPGDCCDRW